MEKPQRDAPNVGRIYRAKTALNENRPRKLLNTRTIEVVVPKKGF